MLSGLAGRPVVSLKVNTRFSAEQAAYGLLLVVFVAALALIWLDIELYRTFFDREDQFIEQLTFACLAGLGFLCVRRAAHLYRTHGSVFAGACVFYAIVFFVGAGEEVSWGQRFLALESPEWFLENNRQAELNIHNLTVGDGQIANYLYRAIGIVLAFYLAIVPFLYKHSARVNGLLKALAVPVPKRTPAIALVLALIVSELAIYRWLVPNGSDELSEFSFVYCVVLVFLFPANAEIFRVPGGARLTRAPFEASHSGSH